MRFSKKSVTDIQTDNAIHRGAPLLKTRTIRSKEWNLRPRTKMFSLRAEKNK